MTEKIYRILVVEDDNDINKLVTTILKKEKYEVASAFSGTEARLLIGMQSFDLLLLDLMLPGISGEELINEIRKSYNMPIIVLTAKGALEDKVKVLELGADDYMTKPFEVAELTARVKAQLRRYSSQNMKDNESNGHLQSNISGNSHNLKDDNNTSEEKGSTYLSGELHISELSINHDAMTFCVNSNPVELTAYEFKIIELLMKNPDKVYSKDKLYEIIWENGYYGEDNTISVHISNIRKKISKYTDKEYIKTVWGIGFKLNSNY